MASNVGTWMHSVAAAWLMTTLAVTPLMIALVQTATFLPTFLFGLFGGVLADLVDRRRILLFTQSWMLGCACLLGLFTLFGWINPWWLLALTFFLGVGRSLNAPAWQTTMPELVPRDELPAVIALNGMQFNIARAVGPALGGMIIAATNAGIVFLIDSVSFLAVIITLWRWKRPPQVSSVEEERKAGAALMEGLRYIRDSREYHALLIRSSLFGFAFTSLWALLPIAARELLKGSSTAYGLLLGCVGLGAVAGAGLYAPLRAYLSAETQAVIAALLGAAGIAGLGVANHFWTAALWMLAAGMAWTFAMSVFNVRAQLAAPDGLRARALAVFLLTYQGAMALGSSFWGDLAGRMGVRYSLVASAAAIVVGVVVTARLRLSPHPDPIAEIPAPAQ